MLAAERDFHQRASRERRILYREHHRNRRSRLQGRVEIGRHQVTHFDCVEILVLLAPRNTRVRAFFCKSPEGRRSVRRREICARWYKTPRVLELIQANRVVEQRVLQHGCIRAIQRIALVDVCCDEIQRICKRQGAAHMLGDTRHIECCYAVQLARRLRGCYRVVAARYIKGIQAI